MFTIVETPLYIKLIDSLLSESDRLELHTLISDNPDIGELYPKAEALERCVMHAKAWGNVAEQE